MKLKLNLHNRLIILSLLPQENNFSTLRIVRKVSKHLGITDEEYKEFGMKPNKEGRVNWGTNEDPKKREEEFKSSQVEKEFEIGEIAHQLIKTTLEKLDSEKKLTQEHYPVYEKIIGNGKEDSEK